MRPYWFLLVALSVLLGLGPVGGAGAAPPSSEAVLTWGEDSDLRTLDPRVSQSRHEIQYMMHIFDTLLFMTGDGKLLPWLAESWEFSKDGKSLTLRLRKGVRFHDNTPFNAEAVKFTFDSIRDPKLGSQAAIDLLGPYRSTDVLDPSTVRINWTRPYGPALSNLTNTYLGIVSPAAVRRLGDNAFSRNPVGTGMFKFVEWVPRERVVLERNDQYNWAPRAFKHQGPPRVRRVVARIITDPSTRVAALEKREIDMAEAVLPIDVKRLKGSRDFDVMVGEVTGFPESLVFNLRKTPTDDVRVRRAFMHAINRPQAVEQLFFGLKRPAYSIVTSNMPGYWVEAEKFHLYDPSKAKSLLDEAGWKPGSDGIRVKDGRKLELFFRSLVFPEVAVAVQAAVKEVGIQLHVENVTKAKQDELILANDYHVLTLSWSVVSPSTLLSIMFHSRNIPKPGKFGFNWNQISSAELDRLLAQADEAIDPQRQERLLVLIQKFVLERALVFPFHPLIQAVGYNRSVTDWTFSPTRNQVWWYDVGVVR